MMKIIHRLLLVLCVSCSVGANAQAVLKTDPEASPFPAQLNVLDGLAGQWMGDSVNGPMEAVFSEARFGQIIGHITYWNDKGFRLIELCSYAERDGSIVYKVKHFNPAFEAREEKEVSVERRLLDYKDGMAYFEDMSVALDGDKLTIYFDLRGNALQANYRRVSK